MFLVSCSHYTRIHLFMFARFGYLASKAVPHTHTSHFSLASVGSSVGQREIARKREREYLCLCSCHVTFYNQLPLHVKCTRYFRFNLIFSEISLTFLIGADTFPPFNLHVWLSYCTKWVIHTMNILSTNQAAIVCASILISHIIFSAILYACHALIAALSLLPPARVFLPHSLSLFLTPFAGSPLLP